MSKEVIWRPGETHNPGYRFKYGDGSYIPQEDVVEILAVFKAGDTTLAKHSWTDRTPDYIRIVATEEDVSGVMVDTYRFKLDDALTEEWPIEGKVRLQVQIAVNSAVFVSNGFIKVFDKVIAHLEEREDELNPA